SLADTLLLNRDLDEALAAAREAIRSDPKYAVAHETLGEVLEARGDYAGAAAAYAESLRLAPKRPGPGPALDRVRKLKAEQDARDGRVAPPPREAGRQP